MDPRPSVSPISALRKRSPSDPDLEDGDDAEAVDEDGGDDPEADY